MLPRRHWHEMTTRDFADDDTSDWIAVLPVAAIEQTSSREAAAI